MLALTYLLVAKLNNKEINEEDYFLVCAEWAACVIAFAIYRNT